MNVPHCSAREAAKILKADPKAFLLDVREPFEAALSSISGAHLIPMGEITSRLNEIPRTGKIIVHCHHGMRSGQITAFLCAHGYDAHSISGGIEAWSKVVDPSVPLYTK